MNKAWAAEDIGIDVLNEIAGEFAWAGGNLARPFATRSVGPFHQTPESRVLIGAESHLKPGRFVQS